MQQHCKVHAVALQGTRSDTAKYLQNFCSGTAMNVNQL